MAARRKSGSRHALLLYRRRIDHLWRLLLLIAIITLAVWGLTQFRPTPTLSGFEMWFLVGGLTALFLSVLVIIGRSMAYVQAHADYLSVVTPFLRFKISYRRILRVHPVLLQQLYPKGDLKGSQRSYVEPFFGKTAVVVELRGYPMKQSQLKLFLPAPMFSPQADGFVFVVPDWMAFSTELDSLRGSSTQTRKKRAQAASSDRYW